MSRPDVMRAERYARDRLERELDPALSYHSVAHTCDDVVPAVMYLARIEGVTGLSLLLLRTAALFHDIGFIEQHADHELIGVRIVSDVLPGFGYTQDQIARICDMIMATKLPQSPRNLLEQLLADADLDVLGRHDFFEKNRALRDELTTFGIVMTDAQWYNDQLRFLDSHRYWTNTARSLRCSGKQKHIGVLEQLAAEHSARDELLP